MVQSNHIHKIIKFIMDDNNLKRVLRRRKSDDANMSVAKSAAKPLKRAIRSTSVCGKRRE